MDASDLLVLAAAVTGGDLVVRDLGLLDAAAHRPRATVLGVQAYETLWLKAAALLDSIVCTRPLVEGNWRLGWVAAVIVFATLATVLFGPGDISEAPHFLAFLWLLAVSVVLIVKRSSLPRREQWQAT